jgi:hypothetical protein
MDAARYQGKPFLRLLECCCAPLSQVGPNSRC